MKLLTFIKYCVIFACMYISRPLYSQQLSQDPLYKLVFSDEFDSIGLNYNKWNTTYHYGFNLKNSNKGSSCAWMGLDTFDYQFNYPGENNRAYETDSGFIRLIHKKENILEPMVNYKNCYTHTCDYTWGPQCSYDSLCWVDSLVPYKYSGAILISKKNFKYGYIEMRYKLSNIAPGNYNAYGPNLWMWNGGTDGINYYNEIDIFEQRGTDWTMDMNCHFCKMTPGYYNQHPGSNPSDTLFWNGKHCGGGTNPPYEPYADQLTNGYNQGQWFTVGCEWTPEHIDSYYDKNDTTRRYSVDKFPVDKLGKMPLIIDCYMPALQYCIPFNDTFTVTPFNYDIDYIRVYQINQISNCAYSSPVTFLNTSSATYESKLYKGLTIGGTGGSAVFSSGNHHLAAQDYVLLQEGFEVNGTANVTISTMKCQTGQTKDDDDYNTFDPNIINDIIKCKRH